MAARSMLAFLVAGALVCATASAAAAPPVGGETFNVTAHIDLPALTRDNSMRVVEPVAKQQTQKEIVFFNFVDTLCELLAAETGRFTQKTGIPARHICVDGDGATRRLVAAARGGGASPADVFLGPNNKMRVLTEAGVIANISLVDLLPNTSHLEAAAARASRGFAHGGTVVPFHRNQTVFAYDSQVVPQTLLTLQEIFQYAKDHQQKGAVTNPQKGGSGSGFLETAMETAMLALAPDCKDDLYNVSLNKEQARAVAEKCMTPVVAYLQKHKAHIEVTKGNDASLQALVNKVVVMATVWEDNLYTLAAKGLVPQTVRPFLVQTGAVGDGDGICVVSSTPALEASLLLVNFLMSDAVQIAKMEQNGSRTARLDLVTKVKIPDHLTTFLVSDKAYQEHTRPRINGLITDAAAAIFVKAWTVKP